MHLPASVEEIRDAIDRSETDRDFRRTAKMRLNHARRYLHLPEALSWDHYARPGAVTILDARARSIDEHDAMSLCLLSLRRLQTVRSWGQKGPSMPMLVVLDEAGRYLHTDRGREAVVVLEGMCRTETHVVMAAQDPESLPSGVISLSSVIILHRMTSPESLRHIKRWCSAFARLKPSDLLSLQPGEAYVWAREATDPRFAAGCVKMGIRARVTGRGSPLALFQDS
ncbi:MAG: hypothetical protein QUS33_08625 [Dehalococcoidia bacterium]|nr:hypothetical protein [Dehalococcoidia bacterium]